MAAFCERPAGELEFMVQIIVIRNFFKQFLFHEHQHAKVAQSVVTTQELHQKHVLQLEDLKQPLTIIHPQHLHLLILVKNVLDLVLSVFLASHASAMPK